MGFNLLVISLILAAVIAVIQIFLQTPQKKIRLILCSLTLAGLLTAFFVTKNDALEKDQLLAAAKKTEKLLEEAKQKMTVQSKQVTDGFSDLKNQFSAAGINSVSLQEAINRLEGQVDKFSADSKSYFTQAISLTDRSSYKTSAGELSFNKDNIMRIPLDYRNSIQIDSKNQFAILDPKSGGEKGVLFKLNGRDIYLDPAAQTPY
ncbi:MAG: hypothetical protein ABIT58_02805, partial [Ferruginibacter sp.]